MCHMDRSCGYIATVATAIGHARPIHGQRQFAVENDMRSFRGVRVIGIARVRRVLPDVCVSESFDVQLIFQFRDIHVRFHR